MITLTGKKVAEGIAVGRLTFYKRGKKEIRRIYVRFWGSERIEQYMRVTVGTREEMEALFAFLRRYIKGE